MLVSSEDLAAAGRNPFAVCSIWGVRGFGRGEGLACRAEASSARPEGAAAGSNLGGVGLVSNRCFAAGFEKGFFSEPYSVRQPGHRLPHSSLSLSKQKRQTWYLQTSR